MAKIIVNYTNELKNVNAGGLDLDISVVKDKPIGEWFTASLGWNGLFAEIYDLCNGACAESDFDFEFNGNEADTAVFDECLKNRGLLNGLENKEEPADTEACRKAAESGDVKAQYLMGEHYWAEYCRENNTGVKWEDAEKWYVMAINQNYAPACFRFGQIHFSANNQDYGIGFMFKAAQQGYVPAMLELGRCYEPAEIYEEPCDVAGIRESTWFRASFDYYKNAAEFGSKEAQNKVMDFCQRVKHEKEDNEQYKLGGFYFYNTGIKKYKNQDTEEAVKWYREAYSRGCDEAKEALVKLDRAAAEKGDAYAQYELAKLITPHLSVPFYMSSIDKEEYNKRFNEEHKSEYEESVKWLKMAAEQGQKDALFELGKRYYWGRDGVDKDCGNDEVKNLFAQAYNMGIKEAFNYFRELYIIDSSKYKFVEDEEDEDEEYYV